MYAPAYAGAAVAEAKAKAKASMAKYLASLVKKEEEGWTVLAAEVPQAPDERFFSSADELEQAPLIPAKRKAEDELMADSSPGVAQVPKALTRPPGAFLELLNCPEPDIPMEELPVQDVADSKEQMILRAVCDERISVPLESLIQFPEVYKALMDRIGGPGALAEVKVNWRCNTKQWWVGAVPDAVAPSIYRKLGYTDDMIKLMGLDPSAPGCRTGADGPDIRPRGGEGDEGIVYPPITSDNVHGVVGKEYRKKNFSAETKHVFWAHMECGLVLSSVTPWELIPKTKGETRGGYMCKYCKGYWRAGGGGTRLLQIRAGKAILQLVLDEPPDGLYNRWVKERLEFYRRVEPSAPLRDVSVVDQKVPRFRFGHTTQTGHVSDAIWELILRNPEAAALKRIDDIAKGAA